MDHAALTRITTQDILESFGLGRVRRGRSVLSMLCHWPARRFARTVAEFDRRVSADGLRSAASWGLQQFSTGLEVSGAEKVPLTDPVFFVSNHPGITDTLALFAAIPHSDLLTIAAERPFLLALSNMSQHLVYVREGESYHLEVVRAASAHLRRCGGVLTFPAGRIEPDPAHMRGAVDALANWSASLDLFARLAPDAWFVPILVSGVYSARSLASPWTRMRRAQPDRERFAAMLQVIAPEYFPVTVRVTFGEPMSVRSIGATGRGAVRAASIKAMQKLLTEAKP